MEPVEIEGKDTEEAIENAKAHFGVGLDKLDIEIVSAASSGIFGLVGGRKARIRVKLLGSHTDRSTAAPAKKEAGPREATPAPETGPDRAVSSAESVTSPAEERPTSYAGAPKAELYAPAPPDQSEPLQAELYSPTAPPAPVEPVEPVEPAEPAEAVNHRAEPRPEGPSLSRPGRDARVRSERSPAGRPAPRPEPVGPPIEISDEFIERSVDVVKTLIEHMGITAEIAPKREHDRLVLNVEGDKSGLLIGRRGQTLDALQYIVSKMLNRDSKDPVRVVLDTEDYRQRRQQSLEDLAMRMGEKARRTGKPITIGAMSAHDRRLIHLALKGDNSVRTRSKGDGDMKKVVIFPNTRPPQ